MESKPIIQVQDLKKVYGQHTLLEDISFTIESGDIVALIGPNGSGKTTLARMIIGLDTPTHGDIHVFGKKPKKQQKAIGYIPQRFTFDRTLPITVDEFLTLVIFDRYECCDDFEPLSIKESLEAVDLAHMQHAKLGTLSGGQLQRVLIARVLLQNRPIMILDEPAAGVDVTAEKAVYDLITDINKKYNTTCIIISHEMDFVFKYATKVLCLNKRLLCAGYPKDAITADIMKKMFGEHMHYHAH